MMMRPVGEGNINFRGTNPNGRTRAMLHDGETCWRGKYLGGFKPTYRRYDGTTFRADFSGANPNGRTRAMLHDEETCWRGKY